MGAVTLWVRSILRRRRGATVALAVLAGLAAGVVGASIQAARRADGAIERYAERSRGYDVVVYGCPPDVEPPNQLSITELVDRCVNNHMAVRLAQEVLADRPEVESWTTTGTLIAGVLDDSARNWWGRAVLITAMGSPDEGGAFSHQILIDGRLADERATDEIMVGELAARAGGIHVGDTLRLASWQQEDIDAATVTGEVPQTVPFESRVVGIVRFASDLQRSSEVDLGGLWLPDALYVRSGWVAAHGDEFAMYGFAAVVRLHDGPDGVPAFQRAVDKAPNGWSLYTYTTLDGLDVAALRRAVESERQAVLIFAIIATIAGMVFVGLALSRQLRRELSDRVALTALGLTRSGLIAGAVARALVAAMLAAGVAVVMIVALSPLGPVGLAGRLEYSHPIRFDWAVLAAVAIFMPMYFAAVATATALAVGRSAAHQRRPGFSASMAPVGPVSRVALTFTRGGSPRLAVAAGAAAVAVAVAAGTLVASFDRVVGEPVRYGAWWDVAVGQYSDPDASQAGIDLITRNPNVADAAGILEGSETAVLDGVTVNYLAAVPIVGEAPTVMAAGQAPRAADEVALGADTAKRLRKGIGDTVTLTSLSETDTLFASPVEASLRVTGIAVLSNPVSSATNAGEGIVVHPDVALLLNGGADEVVQSVVIRVASSVERQVAIDSVAREFPASARLAAPQADLANLERLRSVPWLIAALVGILALASLIHALVTLLQRHARDLAVLAALGMTKRQRRSIGPVAGIVLITGSIAVGVPTGLVIGRWLWQLVARRVFIPSGPVMSWGPAVGAPLIAFVVAVGVAAIAGSFGTRRAPAAQLRSE